MQADAWRRVKEVCAGALDRTGAERQAYLAASCGDDAELRAEVESLLGAHSRAGAFIEQPAVLQLSATLGEESLVASADPNLGRTIGPYVIDETVGHGGMGAVYLGRRADREFEQRVAIKMIRRGMDSDLVIKRFRHERQILASLEHPNIARLFDGGTSSDGLPYFVMEYVDGLPIDRYADAHRLTTPERLRLCLGVFEAVQHAHERSIVHRDLKPSNVLVTTDGRPKLLDFGIAKILDTETDGASTFTAVARPMTPDYASPEQVQGHPITPASDVYALGLLLYELLTGHRPFRFDRTTADERARVVCEEDPERPSTVIERQVTARRDDGTTQTLTPVTVSETRDGSPQRLRDRLAGALDAIVLKALRKEPHQRYASVAALADDVRRYLEAQPVLAGTGTWRYQLTRRLRRHRAVLGTAVLLIAAIGITVVLTQRLRNETASGAGTVVDAGPPGTVVARRSVAVLGFRNLSATPSDGWLSTAIAEMLTTELSGDGQVRTVPAERVARAMRDLRMAVDPSDGAVASDGVAALRRAVGADLVVLGSFASTDAGGRRVLRLDVRVQGGDETPLASASSQGDPAQLFDLVAQAGREVRARLGLKASTPESLTAARAAFPTSIEATRLYAEGTARLRVLDAVTARTRLEAAAALEPDSPLIQTALASAWAALGYDARAAEAAQRAFDVSASLSREDRLNVEGRLHEAGRQWPKAIDVYRTLWGFFADNLEYGLRLAAAQTASGRGSDALDTIAALHKAPGASADPRVDIQEAEAASSLGDLVRELTALRRAAAAAAQSGARGLLARARLLEGRSLYNQGQQDAARAALGIAQQIFEEVGDRAGVAASQNSLASVVGENDLRRAAELYEGSLRISESIGDRRAMSAALNNLGIVLKDQRRFADALAAHQRALALRREIGDRNWTAVSLSNIGVVYFEQDRFRDAATYYGQSLAVARDIGDKRGQVRAQHNLAIVTRELGRLAEARTALEESLVIRREIGDRRGQVFAQVELGLLLAAMGRIADARAVQVSVLQLARDIKMRAGEAQALYQAAETALIAGDAVAARRQHEQALALRRELGETRTTVESESALAALLLEEGQPMAAEREARRLLSLLGDDVPAPARVALHLLVARARLAQQDVAGAATAWAAALPAGGPTERIELRRALTMVEAELALARGNPSAARDLLERLGPPLRTAGLALGDLERRLLLARVSVAEQRSDATPALVALEAEARETGAGLIASRAAALLGRP